MTETGWQPGPPPLDKPGRYDTALRGGHRLIVEVAVLLGKHYWAFDGKLGIDEEELEYGLDDILWHYPIPDPPETET